MMTRKRGSAPAAKASNISLIMESGTSPLSEEQISAKSKAEEEYNQFMKKLNEAIIKRNGEIIESGTCVTVYEIDCTPNLPAQVISKDIASFKPAQGSTILTPSQPGVQSLIPNQSVLLPSASSNSTVFSGQPTYQLVVAPRMGLLVTPSSAGSVTTIAPAANTNVVTSTLPTVRPITNPRVVRPGIAAINQPKRFPTSVGPGKIIINPATQRNTSPITLQKTVPTAAVPKTISSVATTKVVSTPVTSKTVPPKTASTLPKNATPSAAAANTRRNYKTRVCREGEHGKSQKNEASLQHIARINSGGRFVEAPASTFVAAPRCGKKCPIIPTILKDELTNKFQRCRTKDDQDLLLYQSIRLVPVVRRRSRDLGDARKRRSSVRSGTFRYYLSGSIGDYRVCKHCFLGVYGITTNRLRRICNCLMNEVVPVDMRGAGRSANAVSDDIFENVRAHIASFPVHRSRYKNEDGYFLNPQLNVRKMREMYNQWYPDKAVSYWYYLKVFNEEFKLRFKAPQMYVCSVCKELSEKIVSKLADDDKKVHVARKLLHLWRANKFHKKLQQIQALSLEQDDVLGLSFDFMPNLNLPCVPVHRTLFLRQLSVNLFGVNNFKTNADKFYIYDECVGAKGPNNVSSLLWDYVQNDVPRTVKKLHIFCDNCPPQNKNNPVMTFLMSLVQSRFESVHIYFPVRGHAFLPNEVSFADVKRFLRQNAERVYTVREYGTLVAHALLQRCEVMFVRRCDFYDVKEWWRLHYKKNVSSEETKDRRRNERDNFLISKYFHFEASREDHGRVRAREFIDQVQTSTFVLRKKSAARRIPHNFAPLRERKPLTAEKKADLCQFYQYLPDSRRIQTFWNRRLGARWN